MTSSSYISDDSTKLIQRGGGRARGTSSGGGEGWDGDPRDISSTEASIGRIGVMIGTEKQHQLVEVAQQNRHHGTPTTPTPLSTDKGDLADNELAEQLQGFPPFDSSPSYGVVTVLSEPLVCQVEAQLVQPRGASRDGRMLQIGGNSRVEDRADIEVKPPIDGAMAASTRRASERAFATDGAAAPKISTKPGHDQNHLNHDNATAVVETPEGGQSQRGTVMDLDPRTVSAVLGPVVGRAEIVRQEGGARESCRVAVMLEVDGDATVTCLVSPFVAEDCRCY